MRLRIFQYQSGYVYFVRISLQKGAYHICLILQRKRNVFCAYLSIKRGISISSMLQFQKIYEVYFTPVSVPKDLSVSVPKDLYYNLVSKVTDQLRSRSPSQAHFTTHCVPGMWEIQHTTLVLNRYCFHIITGADLQVLSSWSTQPTPIRDFWVRGGHILKHCRALCAINKTELLVTFPDVLERV